MDDNALKLVKEGLLKAMKAEREGQFFYLMAAKSTEDTKGREVFNRLAAEEADHFNYLKGQYQAVLKTGEIDANIKLGAPLSLDGASPIFSDNIKTRIKDAHYEMTALSVAIQLEFDASKFYKDQAEFVDDIAAKTLYLELAAWETGHYRALLAQSDMLKEDYWQEGGFAPF